jgi:signal transduction histidine kinase
MLCKGLIEKNNGKIWVESKQQEGSTFYFSLPAYSTLNKIANTPLALN